MNAKIAIAGLLLASLFGVLLRVPIAGADITILDFAVGVVVLFGGIVSLRSGRLGQTIKMPIVRYLLIFCAVILLSWLFAIPALFSSPSSLVISLLYAIRLLGYLFAGIIIFSESAQPQFEDYKKIILWSGIFFVATGLAMLALFPDFQIFDHLGWDPHKRRLLSTFLDPNFFAIWLSLALSLVGAMLVYSRDFAIKLFNSLAGSVLLIGVFLTLSRSGLLALAGSFGVFALIFFKKWLWVGAIIIVVGVAFVPGLNQRVVGAINLDSTVRLRLNSWEGATTIIKQHPVLGVGYNTLKFRRYEGSLPGTSRLVSRMEDGVDRGEQIVSRADAGFDSSLLTLFATTGVLGLISFLWWVWNAIMGAVRVFRKQPSAVFSVWFLASTTSLVLSSWFVNAWFYPPLLMLWLISWALSTREQHE